MVVMRERVGTVGRDSGMGRGRGGGGDIERERERERGEGGGGGGGEGEREKERKCVCVCVCERERERFFVLFFRKHQYLLYYSFLSMLFSLRGMYTQCHMYIVYLSPQW